MGKCINFVSSKNAAKEEYQGITLKPGQKCSIQVDSSEAMGRVTIKADQHLGVMFNSWVPNMPISIDKGFT